MAAIFPSVDNANEDGLLAVGGSLDSETLITAYKNGIFPWPVEDGYPMTWFAPNPRGIIDLEEFKVSKSLTKFLKNTNYKVVFNYDFEQVITRCSVIKRKHETGTWIYQDIINAYTELFNQGLAYTVAVFQDEKIIGGLYGVCIGEIISGESMFHKKDNASKVALVYLIQKLKEKNIKFIDTQMVTPVIESFGGKSIERTEFMQRIKQLDTSRSREDIFI
jgi:leucyl/phenylalanyl-tRNA--protein transferase